MRKKILKTFFSIVVSAFSIVSGSINAQIVYTDINPDNSGSGFRLDLNNDGVTDFVIQAQSNSDASGYGSSVQIGGISSGNGVAVNQNPPIAITNFARNFSLGAVIDASAFWLLAGTSEGVLKNKYSYCAPVGGCHHGGGGDFGAKDGYLGLRLIVNGQTHYGWARVKKVAVSNSSASYILEDYAFESTSNLSIHAGDKGSGGFAKSSIEGIDEQVDVNKFTTAPNPISASTTISFTLNQTEKVLLRIYDVNGKLISTIADREFTAGTNQLKWDVSNVNAGTYVLRLQSASGVQVKKLIVVK